MAINATDFLVLERDNRGLGIEERRPRYTSVFIASACTVLRMCNISLANSDDLPSGVIPVSKEPFIDVLAAHGTDRAGEIRRSPIGPRLADGSYAILLGTDNDYSVTQRAQGNSLISASTRPGRAASRYPSIRLSGRPRADSRVPHVL